MIDQHPYYLLSLGFYVTGSSSTPCLQKKQANVFENFASSQIKRQITRVLWGPGNCNKLQMPKGVSGRRWAVIESSPALPRWQTRASEITSLEFWLLLPVTIQKNQNVLTFFLWNINFRGSGFPWIVLSHTSSWMWQQRAFNTFDNAILTRNISISLLPGKCRVFL